MSTPVIVQNVGANGDGASLQQLLAQVSSVLRHPAETQPRGAVSRLSAHARERHDTQIPKARALKAQTAAAALAHIEASSGGEP